MLDLLLIVLVCDNTPPPPNTGVTERDVCAAHIEVVASRSECHERLEQIRLTLPANLRIASYPECARDRRERVRGRYVP